MDPIDFVFDIDQASGLRYLRLAESGGRPSSREVANPVQLALADEAGFPHRGRVVFVDNEADAGTGTIRLRARFDNPRDLFFPGGFARVRLVASAPYQALLVPDAAVATDQSRRVLYVLGPGDKLEARQVQLGPLHDGGLRVIRDGLRGDEEVVVGGLMRVRAGQPVAPERPDGGGAAARRVGGAALSNLGVLSVRQPVLACVLSLVLLIVGGLSMLSLPISEYPDVVPPTVVVATTYPGASAQVVADTVATPIEQEVNGTEGMLYMSSQSTADGRMSLTVTFRLGTDPDRAQILVQGAVGHRAARGCRRRCAAGASPPASSPPTG